MKYFLPIFISVVWIGGMIDVINNATIDQLNFTIVSALLLLVATLIFTLLPAKTDDWDDAEERV